MSCHGDQGKKWYIASSKLKTGNFKSAMQASIQVFLPLLKATCGSQMIISIICLKDYLIRKLIKQPEVEIQEGINLNHCYGIMELLARRYAAFKNTFFLNMIYMVIKENQTAFEQRTNWNILFEEK